MNGELIYVDCARCGEKKAQLIAGEEVSLCEECKEAKQKEARGK